jgi:hypothetical protein
MLPSTLKGFILYTCAKTKIMGKKELVDIAAQIHGETEKAWRLFDGAIAEWVPKSQVEDNRDGTFTMPEWLAKDKGFI